MTSPDKTNATRQARFRQAKKDAGFVRYTLWLHPNDLSEGHAHARAKKPPHPIPPDRDPVSWIIGHFLHNGRAIGAPAVAAAPPAKPQPDEHPFTPAAAIQAVIAKKPRPGRR